MPRLTFIHICNIGPHSRSKSTPGSYGVNIEQGPDNYCGDLYNDVVSIRDFIMLVLQHDINRHDFTLSNDTLYISTFSFVIPDGLVHGANMLAPWTLLSGMLSRQAIIIKWHWFVSHITASLIEDVGFPPQRASYEPLCVRHIQYVPMMFQSTRVLLPIDIIYCCL